MEDDLELRMIKLRRMRELLASHKSEKRSRGHSFKEAYELVKKHLAERGEEVLNAALEQYPEAAKRIIMLLASKIKAGKFAGRLTGGLLMQIFDYLGLHVKLKTKILYYRKGEYKEIGELLK